MRLFANLFSAWPYSVTSHHSERMRRAVAELARKERVDVWQRERLADTSPAPDGSAQPMFLQDRGVQARAATSAI